MRTRRAMPWVFLVVMNIYCAVPLFSEPGNSTAQELGDVVFRELNAVGDVLSGTIGSILNDAHGGIYAGTNLPGNMMGDKVIEMSGIARNELCPLKDRSTLMCAKEVNLIREITLESFRHQSMRYYGAFGYKTESGSLIDLKTRNLILQKAYELKKLNIKYIVMRGEGVSNLLCPV